MVFSNSHVSNVSIFAPSARVRAAAEDFLRDLPGDCVYVSTPITTGRPFFMRTIMGLALDEALRARLRDANVRHAERVISSARQVFSGRRVVEPITYVEPRGFRQEDYHALWAMVIQSKVTTVVQCEGWAFSTGCLWELAASLRKGCQILDEEFLETSLPSLRGHVDDAAIIVRDAKWLEARDCVLEALDVAASR